MAGQGFTDGRARFRQIFCELALLQSAGAKSDPGCDSLLWRLADEPIPTVPIAPLPALDPSLRVFIVTGALSDCFGPAALPYREAVTQLQLQGARIDTIRVSGRSGTAHNARQVADHLANAGLSPTDRLLLLGYSKGAVDILEFLDTYPAAAAQVAAVVSLAGPVFGTPLAEKGAWVYDHLLARSLGKRCDPGDGGLVDSMVPAIRREWLTQHPLPRHVAYFSLAAFTTREHLAGALRGSWRLLSSSDRRNDGQVAAGDAVVPGSTLLGFANADHWGLAITIEDELPHLAHRPGGNPLPQGVLFEAMLRQVSEVLAAAAGRT